MTSGSKSILLRRPFIPLSHSVVVIIVAVEVAVAKAVAVVVLYVVVLYEVLIEKKFYLTLPWVVIFSDSGLYQTTTSKDLHRS